AWKNRRHPSQDAEDEPTLRQMMQPELMPDVDTRTDEHGDRRMRIEVGYGLEGAVPDVVAGRLIRERMAPAFREGDYAGGIEAAVDE
ncbi:TPM domain-containing protein, partial [Acinetobacter baumannii]